MLLDRSAAIISYHIIFTIGIIPLILAAMVHFIPVLVRSKKPNQWISRLPLLALCSGILITCHFTFPQTVTTGHYMGAMINIIVVTSLAAWAFNLRNKCIGAPHPCLNWYLAAMMCLLTALAAISAIYFIPAQRSALRLLHLHLNTLGFIGITAIGTLQVLLPTSARRPDQKVASRMHQHLKWMVFGTLITACSTAWHPNLAWVGVTLLAIPVLSILKSWLKLYRVEIFKWNGATPALAAALVGYVVALVICSARAYHHPSFNPIASFIIVFLMPLVTGAVSFLLPLWLRPGQLTAWHQEARNTLGSNSILRASGFLIGGVMVGMGHSSGWYLAVLAAGTFLIQIMLLLLGNRIFKVLRGRFE